MMRGLAARLVALPVALVILCSVSPARAQDRGETESRETEAAPRHDILGPILMMSAGALVTGGGLTLFLVGSADKRAVEGAPDGARWDDYASQADRAPIFLGVGQVMLASGLIVLGAGLTWFILALADANPDPFGTASLDLDLGPTGAVLRGRF